MAFLLGLLAMASAVHAGEANDTARFLAGLPPASGSTLAPMTKEASWARHARLLNQAWQRLDKGQLSRINTWSKENIRQSSPFMLYMFSGPDFLYANAFFPNATTYVLAGLEPVGRIPNVARLSRGARGAALQNLRASMQEVLTYSFFITKNMKSELRAGSLPGALPLLYVFLARSGKTVQSATLVSLKPDGTVTPREGRAPKGSSQGVKIDFSDAGAEKRTLYYFSTDLSNGALPKSGFMTFCESLGPADSLLKSASYLPHSGYFSTARKFLLDHSAVIVQDDSGVPLRFFARDQWDLKPYGRYVGPISIFPGRYQSEMRRLFAGGRAQKINFGIGYRWRTHETNVLLAQKRPPPAAPVVEATPEPAPTAD